MAGESAEARSGGLHLKDLANWSIPPIITWILAAATGAYSVVSNNSHSEPFPVTIIAFLVASGIAGAVCWFFSRVYIWGPVHRFDERPASKPGRPQRESLLTELEKFEGERREKILALIPMAKTDPDEWFKQTEIQFAAYSRSRSLRKGYPEMKRAATFARGAIAIFGFLALLVSIFLLYAPQNPEWAIGAVFAVALASVFGIAVGFFSVNDIPRRADWGSDVARLCDAGSYEDMKERMIDWAESETRSRRISGQ